MMLGQQSHGGSPSLTITAHGANLLVDVELMGKQDPYARFALDLANAKTFQKTYTHKDAGKNPTWNQTLTFPLNGEPDLFVEIMDEETTADGVIAFAAIPLAQVVHAPGGSFNGVFDVYTTAGKPAGVINLTVSAQGVPGQAQGYGAQQGGQPVKGQTYINEAQKKRVASLKNKETAADVGGVALGGLLAVGAGFLANKLVQDNKKEEAAKKEAEAAALAERERFEEEKRRFEQERAAAQHQAPAYGGSNQQQGAYHQEQHQSGYSEHKKDHHKKHHGSDSDSSDSDDDHKKHQKKGKWNPNGTYSAGERVKYQGRKYTCLQAHTSNPTWEPTQAHSLWREC